MSKVRRLERAVKLAAKIADEIHDDTTVTNELCANLRRAEDCVALLRPHPQNGRNDFNLGNPVPAV